MKKSSAMERALDRFGLKITEPLPDLRLSDKKLKEGESRNVVISADSPLGGIVNKVECFDLDEVKKLIGIPDELTKRMKPGKCLDLNLYSPDELEHNYEKGQLTGDQHVYIKLVGRTYVFGNSQIVKEYKRIIEQTHTRGSGRFDITIACFGNIWVLNGWSLNIGSSIQSFCANSVLLEPTARIVRKGNADVNFNVGSIREVQPQLPI